LVPSSIG